MPYLRALLVVAAVIVIGACSSASSSAKPPRDQPALAACASWRVLQARLAGGLNDTATIDGLILAADTHAKASKNTALRTAAADLEAAVTAGHTDPTAGTAAMNAACTALGV